MGDSYVMFELCLLFICDNVLVMNQQPFPYFDLNYFCDDDHAQVEWDTLFYH